MLFSDFLSPFRSRLFLLCLWVSLSLRLSAQPPYEAMSVMYNTFLGGVSGGIGSLINKHPGEKAGKAFIKGFITGCGGGAVMYAGKKSNMLIATQERLGYAWLSRAIFSAGNSIVENASANRSWYSQWHYDLGFIRFEFRANGGPIVTPKLMPAYLGAFVFTSLNGHFNAKASLGSGTLIFDNAKIAYAPYLVGSTTGNNVLFVDTLHRDPGFYEIFAHEMVHTCQFQESSGFNNFLNPVTTKWKQRSATFRNVSKYVYGDLNYGFMLVNYFFVNGGIKRDLYCKNFLENEAEVLTTGRVSCPR